MSADMVFTIAIGKALAIAMLDKSSAKNPLRQFCAASRNIVLYSFLKGF